MRNGLLDVRAVPGMVIPIDLEAKVAIRSRHAIRAVRAEHPGTTGIQAVSRLKDGAIYQLKFERLGENLITVEYGPGLRAHLEYFVTEPIETLIRKRASFIATRQQVRGTGRWYEGLFSLWSMKEQRLRNPDDPADLHPYMVGGADDPGLSKAPFVATKNVHLPDAGEIEKVEYYLEKFVWESCSEPAGKSRIRSASTDRTTGISTGSARSGTTRAATGRSTCGAPSTTRT